MVAVLAAAVFALMSFNLPVSDGYKRSPCRRGTRGDRARVAVCRSLHPHPGADCPGSPCLVTAGITTMGANIINMGVIGGFVGYYTFHGLMPITKNLSLSAFPGSLARVFHPCRGLCRNGDVLCRDIPAP